MIDMKREIIQEDGVSVSVSNYTSGLDGYVTTALIGKATKQAASEVSLESHRQLQFVPDDDVGNGYTIKNMITDEVYIVLAEYPEVVGNELCATITRAIVCNSKLYVSRMVESADRFGNITKRFDTVHDGLYIYAMATKSEVISTKPGEFNRVRYTVYAPSVDIQLTDRIEIDIKGKRTQFKLTGLDYTTFDGIAIVDVESETRGG